MTNQPHVALDAKALEALRDELEGEYGEKVIGKQTLYWLVTACLAALPRQTAEPVAWRAAINPYGQSGFEYADTEQALIDKGRHNRQPLYTHPASPPVGGAPEVIAWCWRFPPGGWHYASEKPEFAPYDAERVQGPFPLALASSERSGREAEYVPTIIRNDGAGFYEFVTEDVPALYSGMMAANVERIGTLKGDLIGFRIYDPLEPRASDRGPLAGGGGVMTSKADRAVKHILLRIIRDPQFAWVMVHTESLGLLLEAQAEADCVAPEDYADWRANFMSKVKTEDVRGKILAEDWENAAHNLFWEKGRDDEFEALRERAEKEAEERRS